MICSNLIAVVALLLLVSRGGLCSGSQNDYNIYREKEQCIHVDPSDVGLVYFYLPNRVHIVNSIRPESAFPHFKQDTNNYFKLNHFYSLFALSKLFRVSSQQKILFYYINTSYGEPRSTHYHQWLNDSFWSSKIPISSVKFMPLSTNKVAPFDNNATINYNLYDILNEVKESAEAYFKSKKHFLLVTSDIILGPRVLSCFTRDIEAGYEGSTSADDVIKNQFGPECFNSLSSSTGDGYFSTLYNLDFFHVENDFSGVLVWNNRFRGSRINSSMVKSDNVYYCSYKSDIMDTRKACYSNVNCIFGYELNPHDSHHLETIFLDKNKNYFFEFLRHHFYGNERPVEFKSSDQAKIPNIVHLIWFGDSYRSLKFIEYICLKSILLVIKPDKIRIHGDVEPMREGFWAEMRQNSRIEWVPRERPVYRYGQNFSESPIQHLADVARLEVMYEEGGIYSDFDIIWVKPLDKYRFMDVDLVASNDITSYCTEFPNSIQIGAFLAPAKSEFVRKWIDGYHKYHLFPGDYVAVSMCEPYKEYEKNPYRVYIDNRLQMIFFNGWSAFIPRYVEIEQEKLREYGERLDFVNDGTHGYHLPRNTDLHSITDFERANKTSLPIQIANYILNL